MYDVPNAYIKIITCGVGRVYDFCHTELLGKHVKAKLAKYWLSSESTKPPDTLS